MRLIGTLPDQANATRLSDYLVAQRLPNHVDQSRTGEYEIWIERDDDVEKAQAEYVAYRSNPTDPRFDGASTIAKKLRTQEQKQAEKRRKQFVDVRTQYAQYGNSVVTFALIAICVAVAFMSKLNMVPADQPTPAVTTALLFQTPDAAMRTIDSSPLDRRFTGERPPSFSTMFSTVTSGQIWRTITPMFIHFGPVHILFNMMMLYQIGGVLERVRGSGRFLTLVIAAALISNLTEALWVVFGPFNKVGFAMFGGMSGVNYALFGYAWMLGTFRPGLGIRLNQQIVGLMLGWLVLCMTGLVGNIANAAHVGGLIVGVIAGGWPEVMRRLKIRGGMRIG